MTDWIIKNMHFYPDSRTCYTFWCNECGRTIQTRDPEPDNFVCFYCVKQQEVDLYGIPELSREEVYEKIINRLCVRALAKTTSLF